MQFIALDTNLITVFQYVKYVTKHCKLDCSQIFQPSALQYSIYCSQASHLALLNEGKDSSTIKKVPAINVIKVGSKFAHSTVV